MAEALSPEDRNVLAGELVLGVLEDADHVAALRLQLSDRDFAADVARWTEDFGAMAREISEADVPAHLWRAIEVRLRVQGPIATVTAMRRWRAGALAAGAIAASLALVILLGPTPQLPPPVVVQAPQPVIVAQLTGAPGAALAARYDRAGGKIRLRTDSLPASALSPELWVIPADGVPRSLGIVAARGESDVAVRPELRRLIAEGAILAVTMEDPATAPHKAPGSAPIATGKISVL